MTARMLLAVIVGLGTTGTVRAAMHRPAVIAGAGAPRPALSAHEAKLDGQLRRLVAPAGIPSAASAFVPVTGSWQQGDVVRVQVRLAPGAGSDALTARGLAVERTAGDVVEGWVPAAALAALAALDTVERVRPARPGRLRATADAAARADVARATGFDGSGVTVGVISDGPGTLGRSIVPAGCDPGNGSEGQAIVDVVGALAPGARVLFASGIASGVAFVDAVQCLQAAGARVIVDDLGLFDEPFFEDGTVAQAVNAAVQAGVSFHSAAGNEAASHYQATFRAAGETNHHNFAIGGAADSYDEIAVDPGDGVDCVLQWNDRFGAAADDYDLELYDLDVSPPQLVVASTDPQTGTQDPYEELAVANRSRTTTHAGIAIRKTSGEARVLSLFCFGGEVPEYLTPAGSVIGHSAVEDVVAVGAVDVSDPGLDTVEPYSSQGPVEIYFPTRETRAKPDLVAFDGVTVATPEFSPFFGTSAAAPDTAAVAALMLSKNGCRTPAQIRDALAATAVDLGVAGPDPVAGAGRLDALAALEATPPPTCGTDAECDDGNPCTVDTCEGCSCEHHTACDDGDPCTVDACDPTSGCTSTPLEGFAGVACVCASDLGAAVCADNGIPRVVQKRFNRACRLVARAAGTSKPGRERRLVARALASFRHARRRMARAANRGLVAGSCAGAVGVTIDDVRSRTARLRQVL